jgi:hypothetical protein
MLGLVAISCLMVFLLVKSKNTVEKPPSKPVVRSDPKISKPPKAKPDEPPEGKTTVKPENPFENNEKSPLLETDPSNIIPSRNEDHPNNGNTSDEPEMNPYGSSGWNNPSPAPGRVIVRPAQPNNSTRDKPDSKEHDLLKEDFAKDDETPALPRTTAKRLPIPAEAARQAAEKSVRQKNALDIAAAKSPSEKLAMSDRLWPQATALKNDAATQYALMSISCQLAADSGRLQNAINRVESFADYFEINPWELKVQAVTKSVKAVQAVPAGQPSAAKIDGDAVVLKGFQLADEAMEAGQYDAASKAVKAVIPLAKKDPIFLRELNAFAKEIERIKNRYQPIKKALDALKDNPDDPDANTLAGRWACFERRDWEKGLPNLAKSSNADLAKTAAKDIAGLPDAKGQLDVADAWWALAQKEESSSKTGMLTRAAYWYGRAQPNLVEADKSKADSRLKSIAGFDAPSVSSLGVIRPGNVASRQNHPMAFAIGPKSNRLFISRVDTLFDGDTRKPTWDGDTANTPLPCVWIIALDQLYQLQEIRFHFFDDDARYYHYAVDVSSDDKTYTTVLDRTIGLTYKWQTISIHGLSVRFIRLRGFLSNKNRPFAITEFEAYCIPPKM